MENISLHHNKLAKELLFVDNPEIYPDEIWLDFVEGIFAYLMNDELKVIVTRYGTNTEKVPWDIKTSRKLSKIATSLQESLIFEEIYNQLEAFDENSEVENDDLPYSNLDDPNLVALGLKSNPFMIGDIEFATKVENNPLFIWDNLTTKMSIDILDNLLQTVEDAGYDKLTIIASDELVPKNCNVSVPYDTIPILTTDNNNQTTNSVSRLLN